jgi:hypothetical protein
MAFAAGAENNMPGWEGMKCAGGAGWPCNEGQRPTIEEKDRMELLSNLLKQ